MAWLPLALLLCAGPAAARGPDGGAAAAAPLRISHLEFNCDLDRCGHPEEYRRFLSLTDLWVGKPYQEAAVQAAVRNLMKTGFFDRVEPFIEEDHLGVSVTLDTVGAVMVRRVEIDADWTILESDVRRRLGYRLGAALKTDEDDVRTQRLALLNHLDKRGYHDSKVDIAFDIQGHEATVKVRIDAGHFYVIREIRPSGNRRVSDFWFYVYFLQPRRFGLSGLYLPETMAAAERDLLDRYHELGFYGARIELKPTIDAAARSVDLEVVVQEGARTAVSFEGNDAVADHELLENLTFAEARSADDLEVDRSLDALRAAYQGRGYHHATVRAHRIEGGDVGEREVVFDVHEGPVARVEAIRFLGNRALSDVELRAVIGTETVAAVLGRQGFALDGQLAADVEAIEARYQEHGFLRATAQVERVDARQGGEYLTVVYRVDEGPQTVISEVILDGVTRYDRATALDAMGLRPGTAYGPRRVLDGVGALQRRYRQDGHPHAALRYECALPNGKAQPCDVARVSAGRSVVVAVHVDEGPRVTVGEIFIRGNFVTGEDTIRKELPLVTGEPFDYGKLLEGQANIRSLRLFQSVRAVRIGFDKGEERDRVAVVIAVEERDYLFADFAFGFQTVARGEASPLSLALYVEGAFINENVLGWGKQVAFPLRVGNLFTAFTPTFTDPRFLGTGTRMDLSVEAAMANKSEGEYLPISTEIQHLGEVESKLHAFNHFEVGAKVGFRREFTRATRGDVQVELTRVLKRVVANDAEGRPLEEQRDETADLCLLGGAPSQCLHDRNTTLRLRPGVTQDRRNSPLHPTQGTLLRGDFTLGAILKGLDPLAGGFSDDQFVKLTGEAQVYSGFLGQRLVLANAARVGLGFPVGAGRRLPAEDLFSIGGATGVRGLADNTTTPLHGFVECPKDSDERNCAPKGGNHRAVVNVELRGRLFWWFWAAAFYDFGVLVDTSEELNEDLAFRHSVGVGLRWLLLDQIPIRADVAFPLGLRAYEERIPFHLAMGYPF